MSNIENLPYPLSHKIVNGTNWEYIVTGNGKNTLVILPGGAQTAESNFRFIRAFEDNFRVIVPTIHNLDSTDEFNTVLNEILDAEDSGEVILYGLSMGGILAQTFVRDNPNRIKALIISHACSSKSETYKRKVINPLRMARIIVPIIPDWLLKFATRFAGQIQGVKKSETAKYFVHWDKKDDKYYKATMEDYYQNFLNKRLIQTTINVHLDFYQQTLKPESFQYLKDRILILRTDNDPLMQDHGDFKKVYPKATVHTFKGTGHLTFHYQMQEMVKVMNEFLGKL